MLASLFLCRWMPADFCNYLKIFFRNLLNSVFFMHFESFFFILIVLRNVFRLSKMGRHHRTRPWSAHESRLQADPIFHMRKRHWEGLVAGKKKLHRGQLLPGSTSSTGTSEDETKGKQPLPICWSECSSPMKQVESIT